MIELKFWQVDAFANQAFKGNPAAVFVLDEQIEDDLMQNIASEMNLPETSFILLRDGCNPALRWFTPAAEIDLCGHATMAAAQIYFSEVNKKAQEVIFDTKFVGTLKVIKNPTDLTMIFPIRLGVEVELESIPNFVLESLSRARPIRAFKSRDLMLIYENEEVIRNMQPDFNALLKYNDFIIVTAKSNDPKYHFISRFFSVPDGVLEDPVTGSAHCTLAPYWAKQLNQAKLTAYQASKRGGVLKLELKDDHLLITGNVITIINGFMRI